MILYKYDLKEWCEPNRLLIRIIICITIMGPFRRKLQHREAGSSRKIARKNCGSPKELHHRVYCGIAVFT
jgi:hypothetical protein